MGSSSPFFLFFVGFRLLLLEEDFLNGNPQEGERKVEKKNGTPVTRKCVCMIFWYICIYVFVFLFCVLLYVSFFFLSG